jgi:phenylacetate-CoA ligase
MSDSFWDPRIEKLPRATRARLQQHRLNWQLRRCWDGSPFYRERLESARLDPSAFADADILTRLPVLRLAELRAEAEVAPPFGRLTVAPQSWWIETDEGRPEPRRVWTDGDVSHRADLAARALWAAGSGPGTVIRLADASDDARLTAALEDAAARIAEVGDNGSEGRQVTIAWSLAGAVDAIVADGPMRVLGHSLVAPTLAYECVERQGLHWAEDHFLIEVVDPETGAQQPYGTVGELLLTDITREGSPLVRLAFGPMAALDVDPCACGRTSARSNLASSVL